MRVGNMLVASYELYRINRPDLSNEVTLYINPTEVMIHDYSIGDDCERFFGRDEHEYRVWVGSEGAARIIEYLSLPESSHPLEDLGLWLLKEFKDDGCAASSFKELAEKAGVEPGVFVW